MKIITDNNTIANLQSKFMDNEFISCGLMDLYIKLSNPKFSLFKNEYPFIENFFASKHTHSLSDMDYFLSDFLGDKKYYFCDESQKPNLDNEDFESTVVFFEDVYCDESRKPNLDDEDFKYTVVFFEGVYFALSKLQHVLIKDNSISEIELIKTALKFHEFIIYMVIKHHLKNDINSNEVALLSNELGFTKKFIKDKLDIF